ncbi:hypothetical protein C8F04DRAFT_1213305 [Mycena alexandri]|uniref:CHY-type domain-containing protein n=1 Tax=Mycena alexandri TaxID=1745969 RepID=A0AAD6SDD5_9AGAR|nr:hypothetical protein C8F04DRAFT_1213305 [Mycena alexandri]
MWSGFPLNKHILNAQVSIRAPCCKSWYDCAECHGDAQTHALAKTAEMTFMCKKCKKADEYCPHCDNHYVIDAKTPKAVVKVEGEDIRVDARMIKDDRIKADRKDDLLLLDDEDFADRLG